MKSLNTLPFGDAAAMHTKMFLSVSVEWTVVCVWICEDMWGVIAGSICVAVRMGIGYESESPSYMLSCFVESLHVCMDVHTSTRTKRAQTYTHTACHPPSPNTHMFQITSRTVLPSRPQRVEGGMLKSPKKIEINAFYGYCLMAYM